MKKSSLIRVGIVSLVIVVVFTSIMSYNTSISNSTSCKEMKSGLELNRTYNITAPFEIDGNLSLKIYPLISYEP